MHREYPKYGGLERNFKGRQRGGQMNEAMQAAELLPCPFCGCRPVWLPASVRIYCPNASCVGPEVEGDRLELSELAPFWNRRAASEWVYCKDRLPETKGRYQVTLVTEMNDGSHRIKVVEMMFLASRWYAEWDNRNEYPDNDVIAWMPLPPPAKMEEE